MVENLCGVQLATFSYSRNLIYLQQNLGLDYPLRFHIRGQIFRRKLYFLISGSFLLDKIHNTGSQRRTWRKNLLRFAYMAPHIAPEDFRLLGAIQIFIFIHSFIHTLSLINISTF